MNQNYLSEEQRTPEWYAARSGRFTGSRFDVLNKREDGILFEAQPKTYQTLIFQTVLERMTGDYRDTSIDSASLAWGREQEPHGKQYYMLETDQDVQEVGFLQHKEYSFIGVSPDGRIGTHGGMELKCPKNSAIHMNRFLDGIDEEIYPQVQGCIWVCEAEWWDFVSYDPRMPAHMKLFMQRIERDDQFIMNLEGKLMRAESDVRDLLKKFSKDNVANLLKRFKQPIEA